MPRLASPVVVDVAAALGRLIVPRPPLCLPVGPRSRGSTKTLTSGFFPRFGCVSHGSSEKERERERERERKCGAWILSNRCAARQYRAETVPAKLVVVVGRPVGATRC
jgi:hypothetical protein